ncbi:hypothetical protein MD484_g7606, partial [Candolleomyces efflorescens]
MPEEPDPFDGGAVSGPEDESSQDEPSQVMDVAEADRLRRLMTSAAAGENELERETAAQERAKRKAERERMLTTVSFPKQYSDTQSFLGFALLDVVNPKDGGPGPNLVLSSFHRSLSTKQLKNLAALAGEDGTGLRNRDYENALIVAIPKDAFNTDCLSQSPCGPHRRIAWKPEASQLTMVLLAGAHRQETSKSLVQGHQHELERLQKKIEKLETRDVGNAIAVEREKVQKVKDAMEPRVVWLVMVFDKEPILEEHRKSAPALLKLITNNRLPPLPDTEEDELANVFRVSYQAGKPYPTDIMTFMKTLNVTRANTYRRLSLRGGDFLSFVIETRASKQFAHFFTDSAKEAIYICSEVAAPDLPQGAEDIDIQYCNQIVDQLKNLPAETYLSTVVLDILMEVADSMFNEHFSAEFISIGTRSAEYRDSFNGYSADLIESFEQALELSLRETPQIWTGPDRTVKGYALNKLRLLLLSQACFRAAGEPHFDSPIPIFSPMCGASMIDGWIDASEGVYMVCSWFLPGITMMQNLTLGRSKSLAITSYPEAILLFLKHWLGYSTHPDWKTSTADDMILQRFEDGELGSQVVDTAFHVIVRLLWRYRQSVLIPAQKLLPPIPKVKAYGTRTQSDIHDPALHTTLAEIGVPRMVRWMKYVAKTTKTKQQDVTHRLHPNIPDPIQREIDQEEEGDRGPSPFRAILQALICSPLNYLISPTGPSNNEHHYLNTLRYVSDEISFYEKQLLPALKHVEPVSALFTELVSVVHQHPDLSEAKFWPAIPLVHEGAREIDAGAYYKLHVRKSRDTRMEVFTSALISFAKKVGGADCLGVFIQDESVDEADDENATTRPKYKIHPALRSTFHQLVEGATLVSHHLAVIDVSPRVDRWPSVDPTWFQDAEEDTHHPSLSRMFSTELETQQHYQNDTAREDEEDNDERIQDEAFDSDYGHITNPLTQSQPKRTHEDVDSPTPSPSPKRTRDARTPSSPRPTSG